MKLLSYFLVALFCMNCVNDRADCNYPFRYKFYNYIVFFPMSADEATQTYGLVKTNYRGLHNHVDPKKADVSVYYAPGYELARFSPRTAKATQLNYSNDIYAVSFHLEKKNLDQILKKLSQDFKKEFIEKEVNVGKIVTYYELNINDCEIITVNSNPDDEVGPTPAVHVVFTYKLIPPEIQTFMRTHGSLRED